jgi:hypothetical protein
MLVERIDNLEWNAMHDIRALPTFGFHLTLDGLPQTPSYPRMLREVRDRMLGSEHSKCVLLSQLFREITLAFSTECLPILNEWLETGEEEKVKAVAFLLRDSPPSFVFTHRTFVERLLGIAHAIGEECLRVVSDSLENPSISEGRFNVSLSERASEMARAYSTGTPQRRFYESLAEDAGD